MKKSNYVSPEVEISETTVQSCILVGSGEVGPGGGGNTGRPYSLDLDDLVE